MEDCREPMDLDADFWALNETHRMAYYFWADMLQDVDWEALDAFRSVPDVKIDELP